MFYFNSDRMLRDESEFMKPIMNMTILQKLPLVLIYGMKIKACRLH